MLMKLLIKSLSHECLNDNRLKQKHLFHLIAPFVLIWRCCGDNLEILGKSYLCIFIKTMIDINTLFLGFVVGCDGCWTISSISHSTITSCNPEDTEELGWQDWQEECSGVQPGRLLKWWILPTIIKLWKWVQ